MGTKAKIGVVMALLSALGLGGYTVVKTTNYGGIEENLHMVIEVIDGDTFVIGDDSDNKKDSESLEISVRILNIAAPDRGECYFEESRDALKELIEGKEVKLRKDVSGVDKFDRLLRHAFLTSNTEDEDDILIAQYMVENGFAKAIPTAPDFEYKRYLAQMENKAISGDLGVWGNCKELPKYFGDVTDMQVEDPDCIIKGNISTENPTKFYFLPNCAPYSQIKIDAERGEKYFCSEKEAEDAGFTKAATCGNTY